MPAPESIDVEFGLLGPLRVAVDGAELELTSPRSRVFLALLALNAGRRVGLHEFAEAIWGEALPKNPRRAAQLCAVRARARLEPFGAGDLVVTQPDGYRLDLAPERTDVGRLKVLLREADAAGDAGGELAAVSAALELWRGEPLADVPSESLQREVAPGLREQRLQLEERRIGILLRSGNAAELVDELVTLTARHPLREGFHVQLMRALRHCGRRGEALEAYHRFRRALGEELGLDPGEEIRALHAGILADAEPGSLPVPRQLPPGTAVFTGRARELAALDGLAGASPGPAVGVITGTAGVGKTTLAVHWGRRVADAFSDGQLFADLRGYHPARAVSPRRVQARFLRALGVAEKNIPTDPEELTAQYRSTLDGRRLLIVLDNAGGADQVRPLLPGGTGSMVLVTSRDAMLGLLTTHAALAVNLDLFSRAEARELLARRLGERVSAEPEAADDIIAASARLPLALAIAAARAVISRSPLGAVAARLRAGIGAFDTGSDTTDVRAVFSWSYRALSTEAARLLRLLSVHPGPHLSVTAATSLLGSDACRPLDELVRAHLVTEVAGRFALHDLMREYAGELSAAEDTGAERDLAARRVLDHFLRTSHAAASAHNPLQREEVLADPVPGAIPAEIADDDAARRWYEAEEDVLLAVLDAAAAAGRDREVWQLVRALSGHFERVSDRANWESCLRAGLAAAERLDDLALRAKAHRALGRMHLRFAALEEADRHLTAALDLNHRAADRSGEAHVGVDLAVLLEQRGDYARARDHALRALGLHEDLGSPAGLSFALNVAAWCSAKAGEHAAALGLAQRARALMRELDSPAGEMAVLDTLGYAHHHLGRYAEAIAAYGESIALARRLGDPFNTAMTLANLAGTHAETGDTAAAREAWREAAEILGELGHPSAGPMREKADALTPDRR